MRGFVNRKIAANGHFSRFCAFFSLVHEKAPVSHAFLAIFPTEKHRKNTPPGRKMCLQKREDTL